SEPRESVEVQTGDEGRQGGSLSPSADLGSQSVDILPRWGAAVVPPRPQVLPHDLDGEGLRDAQCRVRDLDVVTIPQRIRRLPVELPGLRRRVIPQPATARI